VKPLNPKTTDVNRAIKSVSSLNRDEREMYKLLRDEYRAEMAIYEKKRAALNDLQRFITETITRTNLAFIIGLETVYEILHALKKRLTPTDRAK